MRSATVLLAAFGVAQALVAVPRADYGKDLDYGMPEKDADKKPYPPKETDYDCDEEDDYPTSTKGHGHYPKPTTTDKYPHGGYPKPTKGPHGPYKTKTYTKTYTITVSKCDDYVKDCPYDHKKPYTTTTESVYTTVCPEEETTMDYPYPPKETSEAYPEYPEESSEAAPEYPVPTYSPEYPSEESSSPEYPYPPMESSYAPAYPTKGSSPYVTAGAGRVEGGLFAAVAGIAALLL